MFKSAKIIIAVLAIICATGAWAWGDPLGKFAVETLQGNGTPTGYTFAHGGLLAETEIITVGGRLMSPADDYRIDPASGAIVFTQPVEEGALIRASYRYVEETMPATSLGMNFGGGALAFTSAGSTYGGKLAMKTDAGSMQNAIFYSDTEDQSGRAFVHNSDWQVGKLGLKLNLSDIGRDFTGFDAAGLSGLANRKGSKQMGIALNYASANLAMNRFTDDDGGSITSQSLALAGNLSLSFNRTEIDSEFNGFAKLDDPNRGMLSRQAGMAMTDISLGFRDAAKLSLRDIGDESGGVSLGALSLTAGNVGIDVRESSVDEGFNRHSGLTPQDVNTLALGIAQGLSPTATASGDDMQHVLAESGVDRRSIRLGIGKLSLRSLSIDGHGGSVNRQGIDFASGNLALSFFTQKIDDGLAVSQLAPSERQAFGNEYGMSRMNLSGSYNRPDAKLSVYASNVGTADAEILRYGLSLTRSRYSISANFMNMDPGFTRISDLADHDNLDSEQGMRRYDIAARMQVSPTVSLDTFFYNAKHNTDDLFRRQWTNTLSYSPTNGPQVTLFADRKSQEAGEYAHDTYSVSHRFRGISLNLAQDTVREETEGGTRTVDTQLFHVDTDPAGRLCFAGNWKFMNGSDGNFEDNQSLKLNKR
ncbi:MAG: hypothetical protein ACYC2Y_07685, partial [Armatimonadota bacterium]